MAERTADSHPQAASLSSEMFASLFPADCLLLLGHLLELEQQVVDRIFQHILARFGDNNVVKTKWNKEMWSEPRLHPNRFNRD